jgi:UDP-N-acetylglucosamine--N-acetylmuramyl-(pentapeptide) pyrophosphoryl-undecaprenol N-acetylglucosamine transferase
MKLLIAGGGTGGHVIPAMAVAREWLRRGVAEDSQADWGDGSPAPHGNGSPLREVVIVGTQAGLEARLVPQAGLPLETIRAAGLKGMGGAKLLRNAAMLIPGLVDSEGILQRHQFDAALGVGGYASGPMMLLAVMHSIPTVVFEPNVEPGFTNRILADMATRVAVGFDAALDRWGRKAVVTGCPVRAEFFAAPDSAPRAPFRLLITGGSRGALPINRAVVDAMNSLAAKKNQLLVVHQTGERDYNAVRTAYARHEFAAEVSPFIENMAEQFAQADLIVCRAGAITVAEIAAAGRAAIFIPFGAATDAHQLRNAQTMEAAGAARVLPQEELTGERLTHEIFSLLDQPQKLIAMARRARTLARPRAVQDITDLLESVALVRAGSHSTGSAAPEMVARP